MRRFWRKNPGAVLPVALFAAQTFFLWMFFVAGGLERLAELDRIVGPEGINFKATAFDFAARWRHGMTEGWPLYMPGFFVTAIALWRRAIGLSLRRVTAECALTGVLAGLAAWLLAPASAGIALDAFQAQTGLHPVGNWPGVTGRVIGQGFFTLANWNSFILAIQYALIRKSWRPLMVPAALSVVLVLIRPFTVGDFTSLWRQRIFDGDGVAIFSALLIPLLSALLASALFSSQKNRLPPRPAGR